MWLAVATWSACGSERPHVRLSSSGDPVPVFKERVATNRRDSWEVCSDLLLHSGSLASVITGGVFSESSLSQCLQISNRHGHLNKASAFLCLVPALCCTVKSYCCSLSSHLATWPSR